MPSIVLLLAGLFLLSGFSGLVYQIVWLRLLALVFGVTVYAASAVLASFMGGLALGSWLGGRLADRVRNPLRVFGIVELGIAASALGVPAALELASAVYGGLSAGTPEALTRLTLARLASSGLVLLVPTTLMGASLPLVARHAAERGGAAATRIGLLYAANTTGGIIGTALAGFVLIGALGVSATTRLAVAINVMVGLAAIALSRRDAGIQQSRRPVAVEGSPPEQRTRVQRTVLAVFGLAGFAALALEVVWFRLLVLFLPATTYAFTTMLSVVLLGIALGSAAGSALVQRSGDAVRALIRLQIATGVAVVLSVTALAFTYSAGWRTSGMVQASILAMLPATALMGAMFPFGVAIWLGSSAAIGRRVGVLYAINVTGAVAGAAAGGFLFLPLFGTRASLVLLAAVYVLAGVLLAAAAKRAVIRTAFTGGVLFGAATLALPEPYTALLERRYGAGERPVFRSEGVQTTATVHRQPSGRLTLYLDGLHQANDSADMVRVHAEIGHLPMVLHQDPRRALVIGLGGGVTAGAVAAHSMTHVDVVELARSVVAAASLFGHVNNNVLDQPRVRLRIDDGRNYLMLTRRRYDVLTADIIQPVHAGAGNLYSVEYFRLARRVLRDDGVMLQWIGHREEAHYKLIMRTFLAAFPHATLWSNGTLMVGTVAPLQISRAAHERRASDPDVRFALTMVGLDTFDALLARYTAGPDEMRRFVGDGLLLTDDRPLLEYHRSVRDAGRPVDVSSLRGDVARHVIE